MGIPSKLSVVFKLPGHCISTYNTCTTVLWSSGKNIATRGTEPVTLFPLGSSKTFPHPPMWLPKSAQSSHSMTNLKTMVPPLTSHRYNQSMKTERGGLEYYLKLVSGDCFIFMWSSQSLWSVHRKGFLLTVTANLEGFRYQTVPSLGVIFDLEALGNPCTQ